jgi:hypothetical protein
VRQTTILSSVGVQSPEEPVSWQGKGRCLKAVEIASGRRLVIATKAAEKVSEEKHVADISLQAA